MLIHPDERAVNRLSLLPSAVPQLAVCAGDPEMKQPRGRSQNMPVSPPRGGVEGHLSVYCCPC